jgi:hypothetical protein
MVPRTNLPPIHFYNKINPIWWFGNVDEPRAPDWYRPDGACGISCGTCATRLKTSAIM